MMHMSNNTSKHARHPYNLRDALTQFERGYVRNILELTRWNLPETARMLGIRRMTLDAKIRKYNIKQ